MADLNEIGFDISDNDEVLNECPSPPPPFHHGRIERSSIIVEPPVIFTDSQIFVQPESFVPFDNIFFHDAKTYLFETTENTVGKLPNSNENLSNRNSGLFSRFLNFFRSSIFANDFAEFDRQCEQLMNLANYPCVMTDRIHTRILYTIYRRLTSSKEIFHSTTGPHWEEIGFQNTNPETDFRATGLFSVFCLLYFVDSMYLPLAKQIHQLSRHSPNDFPFCCVGINLSNMILKNLQQSSTRKNLRKSIELKSTKYLPESTATDLVGRIFTALFLSFYLKWDRNHCTIADTGKIFKELEEMLNHQPKTLLQQFDDYFRQKQTKFQPERQQTYQIGEINDNLI